MNMATKQQERVIKVLDNMKAMALENEDDAEMFAEGLDFYLNELNGEDAFGTEGQSDPRGDFRDGDWSMKHVQGIDG
jgi:hypothetical protein